MSSAVTHSGKWRIKPSGKLPIFLRFVINSSFTVRNARLNKIKHVIGNRTYLNHMMYWPAKEYNLFEAEVIGHLNKNDGWFERYNKKQLKESKFLYSKGNALKRVDWKNKTNQQIKKVLDSLIEKYQEVCCGWYVQYPLDEYFEGTIERQLSNYIRPDDHDFRKYVLIFSDPKGMTEVAQERYQLLQLAQHFFSEKKNTSALSSKADRKILKHLGKYAYINRGLATSKPYSYQDIVKRLKEIQKQLKNGSALKNLLYEASEKKLKNDYRQALQKIKPRPDFARIIQQAREHSYVRNRRVEAFFKADYGASFMYTEIARRAAFDPDEIMDVSVPEMYGVLEGNPLPKKEEMMLRHRNYAMVVRQAETKLITDPQEVEKLMKEYFVNTIQTKELHGVMACLGGIIRGYARVCLDKHEISKVKRGDILVTQFTTPDFVPAMEKAAAIVADQGGLSSHAAIVSRELGVPCVIATKNGTRVIKDNDYLEIDARKGTVKILRSEND